MRLPAELGWPRTPDDGELHTHTTAAVRHTLLCRSLGLQDALPQTACLPRALAQSAKVRACVHREDWLERVGWCKQNKA